MDRFLAALDRQQSVSDVLELLGQAARRYGAERYSYHFTPAFEKQTGNGAIVTAQGFGQDWISLYDNENFRRADPIPDYVMRKGQLLTWRHALDQQSLSHDALDFVEALRTHKLLYGFGVPSFGPNNRNAYVAFGFAQGLTGEDEARMGTLAAIAQSAHLKICQLAEPLEEAKQLSERERQVLHWVGRGKSNSDIATILGVSPETVKTYLRRIYGKLDVADRVGATVKALKLSIITL